MDLAENQVLLFDPANTFPGGDTLNIDAKTFEIVPSDYVMPKASTLAQIYEMLSLIHIFCALLVHFPLSSPYLK